MTMSCIGKAFSCYVLGDLRTRFSGIIFKATGMTPTEFANEYLFGPLGIAPRENFFAANAEDHIRVTTDKAPKGKFWLADPQGISASGYGLCMSAEEM